MRADLFIAAEAARATDHRLFIHGAGITRIDAPSLPWSEEIAFAIRLIITSAEVGPHEMALRAISPDGETLHEIELPFHAPEVTTPLAEGEQMTLHAGLTMSPLTYVTAGAHRFELIVDGELLATDTIAVVEAAPAAE